mgnify:CR=1 FL=1
MNSETLHRTADSIAPRALYIEVADRLRRLIQSHAMTPGEWIDEQALATQYGISRTPLREALKVLATEGMVVLKPRRGCYVAQISGGDLEEIYPIMALLEGECAAGAARRGGNPERGLRSRRTDPRRPFARKPSGRRVFWPGPALARSLQPTAGMRGPRRLGPVQNPSPQAPAQF